MIFFSLVVLYLNLKESNLFFSHDYNLHTLKKKYVAVYSISECSISDSYNVKKYRTIFFYHRLYKHEDGSERVLEAEDRNETGTVIMISIYNIQK